MPVTYENLINKEGTIYNELTGVGYKKPEELAVDLGIQPHQIDWTKIRKEVKPPVTEPIAPPKSPVAPVTYQTPPGTVTEEPPAPTAPPAKTTTQPVQVTTEPKPYIRNPAGADVYDRQGNYISAQQAAQIPNFWDLVDIDESAPNTSKGVGLGGPVSGLTTLPYITYNGIDVYNKDTGEYIDFETAKKLDIWNQIETAIDEEQLEEMGIDTTGEEFKSRYGLTIPKSPYQEIFETFKKELEKTNDDLEQAWLEYEMDKIAIEENPWMLVGEQMQELKKLKKEKMAKINALTNTKSNMLEQFQIAIGLTEKIEVAERWERGYELDVLTQLRQLEEDQTVEIGGITYTGLKKVEIEETDTKIKIVQEEDAAGNVTMVGINESTGEILWRQGLGKIGAGRAPSTAKTEQEKIAEAQEKRDEDFERFVKDMVKQVYAGDIDREQAKAQIKTLYPEYDENVIYDLVPD